MVVAAHAEYRSQRDGARRDTSKTISVAPYSICDHHPLMPATHVGEENAAGSQTLPAPRADSVASCWQMRAISQRRFSQADPRSASVNCYSAISRRLIYLARCRLCALMMMLGDLVGEISLLLGISSGCDGAFGSSNVSAHRQPQSNCAINPVARRLAATVQRCHALWRRSAKRLRRVPRSRRAASSSSSDSRYEEQPHPAAARTCRRLRSIYTSPGRRAASLTRRLLRGLIGRPVAGDASITTSSRFRIAAVSPALDRKRQQTIAGRSRLWRHGARSQLTISATSPAARPSLTTRFRGSRREARLT